MTPLISERELDFLLYEFLDTEALLRRPRYAEHSREVFTAILQTARTIALDLFAPHNALGDRQEPVFKDGAAHVIPETAKAWQAFADAGFLAAHWEAEQGGAQLPEVILRAALTFFSAPTLPPPGIRS